MTEGYSEREEGVIPHTVEDVPDMRSTLGSIRKASIWSGVLSETIDTSWPPGDFRSSHLLDGSNAGKSPQVTVADPWELGLDLLQQSSGNPQTVVGAMNRFRLETHGGIIAMGFTTA